MFLTSLSILYAEGEPGCEEFLIDEISKTILSAGDLDDEDEVAELAMTRDLYRDQTRRHLSDTDTASLTEALDRIDRYSKQLQVDVLKVKRILKLA